MFLRYKMCRRFWCDSYFTVFCTWFSRSFLNFKLPIIHLLTTVTVDSCGQHAIIDNSNILLEFGGRVCFFFLPQFSLVIFVVQRSRTFSISLFGFLSRSRDVSSIVKKNCRLSSLLLPSSLCCRIAFACVLPVFGPTNIIIHTFCTAQQLPKQQRKCPPHKAAARIAHGLQKQCRDPRTAVITIIISSSSSSSHWGAADARVHEFTRLQHRTRHARTIHNTRDTADRNYNSLFREFFVKRRSAHRLTGLSR